MPLQILLAEDNPTFANSVNRLVGLIGGAQLVGHARDGEEALDMAGALHPEVILMDIAMPKLSGLQVAHRLQTAPHRPVIIFLSMHSDPSYRDAAHAAGGAYFVTKANFVSELLPLLEQMVQARATHPMTSTPLRSSDGDDIGH